jgi:transcriptional regulator with XRE-family HTH domain
MPLKENLAVLLAQRDMNQTQLAKATGIPQPTINRILTGETASPRIENVNVFADYFGVTVEALLGNESPTAGPAKPPEPALSPIQQSLLTIVENLLVQGLLPDRKCIALIALLNDHLE